MIVQQTHRSLFLAIETHFYLIEIYIVRANLGIPAYNLPTSRGKDVGERRRGKRYKKVCISLVEI